MQKSKVEYGNQYYIIYLCVRLRDSYLLSCFKISGLI